MSTLASAAPARGLPLRRVLPRASFALALAAAVLLAPVGNDRIAQDCTFAAVYAIVGLSMNVLVGYTGQISLGQQGFVGLGSMAAANVAASGINDAEPLRFAFGLAAAALLGGAVAVVLGIAALRITGLYLALLTLVFGETVAQSVLSIPALDGQAAGVKANRPTFLLSDYRLYLFALAVLAVVFVLDRRLVASKAGRALLALKENERAAAAFGINVTAFKLLAFALSGALAGLAGGVLVYISQDFSQKNFTDPAGLNLALTFVVIAVVGGLGSRAGVVLAAAFFGLLPFLMQDVFTLAGGKGFFDSHIAYLPALIGAVLLLQTVIANPGGLGQVIAPISRWLAGGSLRGHHDGHYGEVTSDVRA